MNNSKSDFTQGSILGKLLPFMMPILGALVLQAAYGAGACPDTAGALAVSILYEHPVGRKSYKDWFCGSGSNDIWNCSQCDLLFICEQKAAVITIYFKYSFDVRRNVY